MIGSTIFHLIFIPKTFLYYFWNHEVLIYHLLFCLLLMRNMNKNILTKFYYICNQFSFDTMKILSCHRTPTTRFLSQGYEGYHFLNTFKKFYCRNNGLVGQYRKISAKCSWSSQFDWWFVTITSIFTLTYFHYDNNWSCGVYVESKLTKLAICLKPLVMTSLRYVCTINYWLINIIAIVIMQIVMILLDCIDFCISLNRDSCLEFLFDSLMFLYLLLPKNVISCGCFPYDMTEDLSSFILFYVVDFGGCNWLIVSTKYVCSYSFNYVMWMLSSTDFFNKIFVPLCGSHLVLILGLMEYAMLQSGCKCYASIFLHLHRFRICYIDLGNFSYWGLYACRM